MRDHQAKTCADAFINHVAAVHGVPTELVSDGAPEFRSALQQQLFRMTGVVRRIVTPYRPQANGQVERFFRTLRPLLAAMAHKNPRHWDRVLPHVVHAYNTSYNAVIQNTPFYLMYGRDPCGVDPDDAEEVSDNDALRGRLRHIRAARRLARRLILREQRKNRALYDKRAKPLRYEVGDAVFVKVAKPAGPVRKLAPKYVGPYRVTGAAGSVLYVVPVQFPQEPERQVHADRVRPGNRVRPLEVTLDQLRIPWGQAALADPNLEAERDD